MPRRHRKRRLGDEYRFPGFVPSHTVTGLFGEPAARVITLTRREKKTRCGACGWLARTWYDRKRRRVRDLCCGDRAIYLDLEIRRVYCRRCQRRRCGDHRPGSRSTW